MITGGSSGIGRAIARLFADEGADVLVVGRNADRLSEATAGRPGIRTPAADVSEPHAPQEIVVRAVREFGRIDALVNNSGITRPALLGETDPAQASQPVATELVGPILLNRRRCHTWHPAPSSSTSLPTTGAGLACQLGLRRHQGGARLPHLHLGAGTRTPAGSTASTSWSTTPGWA
ncbi:SDR family oxidoreductase (plasmid) [Streptomyces sp. NBC_00390]|uniref:SDR family oxidoreductase n=1 Tax=Streptomyces sp. NBC_00390 TaxID=2975736 RepID=UPI002E1C235B